MKNDKTTNNKLFNLIDEPWIKVVDESNLEKEVSIYTLFQNARHYKRLAGETPQQDAAVLRFLLAILITVFYRYDENGEPNEIDAEEDEDTDVIERWQAIWKQKAFPMKAFDDYFAKKHERFWLFHPERPFLQVPGLEVGTDYPDEDASANVFFADMRASNHGNATRFHFSMRSGDTLFYCNFSEAARWLIHMNAYSMNVRPPETEKDEKTGKYVVEPSKVGKLGQLGLILANGDNLFKTLMLNATVLEDGEGIWPSPHPTWERKDLNKEMGVKIGRIDNLPEMYTIPSRKMLLTRENNRVVDIKVAKGEFYDSDFKEQMTIWEKNKKKGVAPKKFDIGIQAWREFPVIFNVEGGVHEPGLISWLRRLEDEDLLKELSLFRLSTVGMTYGTSGRSYEDSIYDSLSLSYQLLASKGENWIINIADEINKCDDVASKLVKLGANLGIYVYGTGNSSINKKKRKEIKDNLTQSFYASINVPFRDWLQQINPSEDSINEKRREWQGTAYNIAKRVVNQFIEDYHFDLFVVRKYKRGKKIISYNVSEMVNEFFKGLKGIYG